MKQCPTGEPCIRNLCQMPGCVRQRLLDDGYVVKDGVIEAVPPVGIEPMTSCLQGKSPTN